MFLNGVGVRGRWALIRGWALINFFRLKDGRLFEVGANSRLGAYSNKYGNFKSETCFNQLEALWVVTPHWSSSVGLCWYEISTRVSQTSFRGGTSSGRPFSGQQTINIKTFNTLFFLLRDIFLRHTISLLSCHTSGVTNWLGSKNCEIEKSKN